MESSEGLLLVRNVRRSGTTDWSTPGGVIDATDASLRAGLTREVEEETGLRVTEWEGPIYEVRATAPEMGWIMRCEVHRAIAYEGDLVVDDPDGIVVEATFAAIDACRDLLVVVRSVGPRAARRLDRASGGDPTTRAPTPTTCSARRATTCGWYAPEGRVT